MHPFSDMKNPRFRLVFALISVQFLFLTYANFNHSSENNVVLNR